jgi:phosphoribosylanthranilate isomerase
VRIKICGLFRDEDIEAANRAMPDYAGWVFAPSRRRVSVEWAARARARLDPAITPVGVFVDEAADRVVALLKLGVIDIAQLHGRESESLHPKDPGGDRRAGHQGGARNRAGGRPAAA